MQNEKQKKQQQSYPRVLLDKANKAKQLTELKEELDRNGYLRGILKNYFWGILESERDKLESCDENVFKFHQGYVKAIRNIMKDLEIL